MGLGLGLGLELDQTKLEQTRLGWVVAGLGSGGLALLSHSGLSSRRPVGLADLPDFSSPLFVASVSVPEKSHAEACWARVTRVTQLLSAHRSERPHSS